MLRRLRDLRFLFFCFLLGIFSACNSEEDQSLHLTWTRAELWMEDFMSLSDEQKTSFLLKAAKAPEGEPDFFPYFKLLDYQKNVPEFIPSILSVGSDFEAEIMGIQIEHYFSIENKQYRERHVLKMEDAYENNWREFFSEEQEDSEFYFAFQYDLYASLSPEWIEYFDIEDEEYSAMALILLCPLHQERCILTDFRFNDPTQGDFTEWAEGNRLKSRAQLWLEYVKTQLDPISSLINKKNITEVK